MAADEPVVDRLQAMEFHGDLERIARRELRRMARSGGTIDTVALVSEAYLKLGDGNQQWNSRGHFLASMTRVMRHVLVDYARERGAQRRGGDWLRVTTGQYGALAEAREPVNLIQLDQVMTRLGELSARLERVVELKVFGGMTNAEVALALEISTSTVARELRVATAFLRHSLAEGQ